MVSNIFYFHPYLRKWSNLTSIFFRWVGNHQLDKLNHPQNPVYHIALLVFCRGEFVAAQNHRENFTVSGRAAKTPGQRRGVKGGRGSMGRRVYLPTWIVDSYGKFVGKIMVNWSQQIFGKGFFSMFIAVQWCWCFNPTAAMYQKSSHKCWFFKHHDHNVSSPMPSTVMFGLWGIYKKHYPWRIHGTNGIFTYIYHKKSTECS